MRAIGKLGSDYDTEWLENRWQTVILSYCNENGDKRDFKSAQEAFLHSLSESQAPLATIKFFMAKLEMLLKQKKEANQPTQATECCLDYFKFQLENHNISLGIYPTELLVEGNSIDLEKALTELCDLPESVFLRNRTNPPTHILIKCRGHKGRLQMSIHKKFPNLQFPDKMPVGQSLPDFFLPPRFKHSVQVIGSIADLNEIAKNLKIGGTHTIHRQFKSSPTGMNCRMTIQLNTDPNTLKSVIKNQNSNVEFE